MKFTRRYVLIAMGCNEIKAFFNTLEDAEEHATFLRNKYPTSYQTIKIFKEVNL